MKFIDKWIEDSLALDGKQEYYFGHPLFYIEKENQIGSSYHTIDYPQGGETYWNIQFQNRHDPPISVMADFARKLNLEFEGYADYWDNNCSEQYKFENNKLYKKEVDHEDFEYFQVDDNSPRIYRRQTPYTFDVESDEYDVETDYDLIDEKYEELKYEEVEF